MVLIGLAIVVRTLAEGGGALALGLLMGVLFVPPASVGLYLERRAMKPLAQALGAPALFGIVQGFVAASVYFAVGLVAQRALGFTWVVFLAGGLLFALVVALLRRGRLAAPGARRRDRDRALRLQRAGQLHRRLGDPASTT